MGTPIAYHEPKSFAAGETVQWQRAFADYPSTDGWTVRYYFAGPDVFQAAADSSTGAYVVTLTAVETADLLPGIYNWRAYAEQGAGDALERRFLAEGAINVVANFVTAQDADLAEDVVTTLAAIESVLAGRITADIQAYTIAGRAVTKIPISELMQMRGIYAARVWKRQHQTESAPQHQVDFTGPRQDAPPMWSGLT